MLIPISAFTPEQQALFQPGKRLDLSGDWMNRMFVRNATANPDGSHDAFLTTEQHGPRADMLIAQHTGEVMANNLMAIGMIDMAIVSAVPAGWLPGDPLAFPDSI